MMLSRLSTYTLAGIEAHAVDVEVDISPGAMPKTILVGLPEAAVKESTHRVERAHPAQAGADRLLVAGAARWARRRTACRSGR